MGPLGKSWPEWTLLVVTVASAATLAEARPDGDVASGNQQPPARSTLCELVSSTENFHGKLVQIRAIVQTGFQTSLLRDDACSAFIWFAGADDAQADPALKKSREYQKMVQSLNKKYKPKDGSECSRCALYKVTVTVIGRFEHISKRDGKTEAGLPAGFGYLNSYDSQLVLQKVLDVTAEEIDRSGDKKED